MTEFFLTIVNMSISASWIVFAVLFLRLLLKKAPKWITVLLWGIVAVRLVCPFSVESVLSLIPSSQTINPEVALNPPAIDSGVPIIDNVVNPIIGEATITLQPEKDLNFFQFIMPYLAGLWLVGITALLIYTVVSYVRVKRKIGTAVLLRDNIFLSESVISPFVLGIIKPNIYLPFKMNGQDMEHVISHEQAHIHRKDHLWKPLGFLILTLHWFNPLMWLGYILLCRDIELACDEKVIKELDTEQKADYSQALLTCSVNRRMIAACPLAFGEVGVKDRVKSVLNYKKPAFWIIIFAIIVSIMVAVCFLTNPKKEAEIFTFTNGYTTHDKVDVAATELMVGDRTGHIIVNWNNQTNKPLSYGSEFHIYRKVFGIKVECKNNNDGWDDILYEMDGTDGERTISLDGIEIKSKGDYVLEFDFNVSGDNKEYTAYIEFKGENEDNDLQSVVNTERLSWTYSPILSHTSHYAKALYFNFDYTHIEATCTNGEMWNLDTEGQPRDTTMRFENGKTVYWTPSEGVIEKVPQKSEVTLTIYNDKTQLHKCTVVFECVSRDEGSAEYEIYLKDANGLQMVSFGDGIKIIEKSSISNVGGVDTNNEGTFESTVSYANWTDASELYAGALNGPVDPNNSITGNAWPLPIYKFDTLADLKQFKQTFGSILTMDSGCDEVPSFNDATAKYDSSFFEENSLLLVYVRANNCTHRFCMMGVNFDNNRFHISVGETTNAETVDTAMAGWFITVAVSDEILDSIHIYNAELYYGLDVNSQEDESHIEENRNEQDTNSSYVPEIESDLNTAISAVLRDKYRAEKPDGLLHINTYYLLANETASGTPLVGNSGHMEEATVYLIVYHMKYSVNGGQLEEVEDDFVPTAITFSIDKNGGYSLKEYWTPRSGANYEKDIRAKFPGASAEDALDIEKYAEDLTKESWRQATEYLNKINGTSSTVG